MSFTCSLYTFGCLACLALPFTCLPHFTPLPAPHTPPCTPPLLPHPTPFTPLPPYCTPLLPLATHPFKPAPVGSGWAWWQAGQVFPDSAFTSPGSVLSIHISWAVGGDRQTIPTYLHSYSTFLPACYHPHPMTGLQFGLSACLGFPRFCPPEDCAPTPPPPWWVFPTAAPFLSQTVTCGMVNTPCIYSPGLCEWTVGGICQTGFPPQALPKVYWAAPDTGTYTFEPPQYMPGLRQFGNTPPAQEDGWNRVTTLTPLPPACTDRPALTHSPHSLSHPFPPYLRHLN